MPGSNARKPSSPNDVDWDYLRSVTDEEIQAQIDSDPDTAPIADEEWFKGATLVLPEQKTPVSLRVDSDVFRAFHATGAGYQQRMNAALRAHAVREGWLPAEPARPPARRGRPRKAPAG